MTHRHAQLLPRLTELAHSDDVAARQETAYGETILASCPESFKAVLSTDTFVRSSLLRLALGRGSLSTDGAEWEQLRRITQGAFSQTKVKAFAPLFVRRATAVVTRVREQNLTMLRVDEAMARMALEVISEALLGRQFTQDINALSNALTVIVEELGMLGDTLFGLTATVRPDAAQRFRHARAHVDGLVERAIERHIREPGSESGLLSRLLAAERSEPNWSRQRVHDELLTVLVAGHETTAGALSWALLLLVEHPAVEARWREELAALRPHGALSYEDLRKLPVTRSIMDETLRLYPSAWAIARVAATETDVCGRSVPPGSTAFACPYTLHRNAKHWQDPETFDPGRFERSPSNQAYFPFGYGGHRCVGAQFALVESCLALATLGRGLRLGLPHHRRPRPHPLVTLRMDTPLYMPVEVL